MENQKEFVWESITSVDELGQVRMAAMNAFLADYPAGLMDGRYVNGALASLASPGGDFGLALCSHLLFLYSQQLGIMYRFSG